MQFLTILKSIINILQTSNVSNFRLIWFRASHAPGKFVILNVPFLQALWLMNGNWLCSKFSSTNVADDGRWPPYDCWRFNCLSLVKQKNSRPCVVIMFKGKIYFYIYFQASVSFFTYDQSVWKCRIRTNVPSKVLWSMSKMLNLCASIF